jgi:hypothetical protein
MIFLRDNGQHESVETPNLAAASGRALAAQLRALDPVVIGSAQLLEIVVTHSKQTTATCSNRYFFGTFRAARDFHPILAPRTPRA